MVTSGWLDVYSKARLRNQMCVCVSARVCVSLSVGVCVQVYANDTQVRPEFFIYDQTQIDWRQHGLPI